MTAGGRARLRRLLLPALPALRLLRRLPQAWRARRAARCFRRSPALPGIAYLHPGFPELPPGPGEITAGGAVMLTYLTERFPATFPAASILYGVSSVYHPDAMAIVKSARRAGVRFVLNQNGVYYPAWFGAEWKEYNRPLARLLQSADFVVYQSDFCRRCADQFLGPAPHGSTVLFNPVDLQRFQPGVAGRRRPVLLCAAADAQRRDRVEVAVETLGQLVQRGVDIEMLVAGYNADRPGDAQIMAQLTEQAYALRIPEKRLRFHPRYARIAAPSVFAQADILLHPVYNDPSPNFVGEALAAGLPVVYSATGGTPEIVGPSAGIGIPAPESWERMHPPTAAQLVEAVLQVVDRLPNYALAARTRAEEALDLFVYLDAHARIFAELEAS
jgi:glycosyltransferase involved in cell wall biosynthesis